MATAEPTLKNDALDVNCAQISFDPSGKIVDILSKCTCENDLFKRIVGAVTIIFTDNADVTTDKSSPGLADELCHGKVWRNIPATLSIIHSPGRGLIASESSSSSIQSPATLEKYNTDTQLNGKQGRVEGNDNGGPNNTLDMSCRSSPVNTSSSLQKDELLIDYKGVAILVKQEPMSPDLDVEPSTQNNFEDDSVGSVPTNLSHGDNTVGIEQDSFESHISMDGQTNSGQNNYDKKRHSSGNLSLSKCSVCFREIHNRKEFTFHAKAHKNVLGSRESCPVCLKSYKRRLSLMRHSYLHLSNDLYCCPVCQVNISQLDSFKRHFHKRHPASLSKLRRYLANFRHNNVSRQASEVAEMNGQSTTHDFTVKECLDQTNVEKNRKVLFSMRKKSQTSVQLRSRKRSVAQKMQLDIGSEGIQGVNIITDMDQSSYDSSPWHDLNTDTNTKEFESESSNQTNSSVSGAGYLVSAKTKKTSKCSFCWSEMVNLEDFVDHMEAHKAIMKVPYTCPVCLHEFSDKMRVKRHASRHVQTAMYVCRLCKIQIPRVDSFRRHIKKVHPQHDMELLLKYSMPSSDVTERGPDPYSESTNVPISSSDAYSIQHPKSDHMYSRKGIASYNFCTILTQSEDHQIKQELPSSENEDYTDANSYTDFSPAQPSATMSMLDIQGYQDEFVPSSEPPNSVVEPPMQQDPNEQGDTSWHVDTDQQYAQATDNTLINPFLSKNTNESSTSASHGSTSGNSSDVCNTTDKSSSPATFLAPKRGGYRQTKTPIKFDPSPTQSSPFKNGSPVKKKTKKKDLSSVCFFCSAVLTNTQQFLEHARLHAKGDKITCPVCVTDYARKLGLMRHSVNHVPSDAHICDICGTSFARRDVMLRHYRKVHKMTPNYMRQETLSKSSDSYMLTGVPDPDELPILSFDSITAPSIPPMPGDSDSQISGAGVISMGDENDMMYSCGLCGAQYHDAQTLQDHVLNHPHDI